MVQWLVFAAAFWLFLSSGAQAQMKSLGAVEIAEVARNRTLDLRIAASPSVNAQMSLVPNMVVHHNLTPNAAIGVGLANIYAKRRGSEFRLGQPLVRSHKPAMTFVFKF